MLISITGHPIAMPVIDIDGVNILRLMSMAGHATAVPVIDIDGTEVAIFIPAAGHLTTALVPMLGAAVSRVIDAEGTSTL